MVTNASESLNQEGRVEAQRQAFALLDEIFPGEGEKTGEFRGMGGWLLISEASSDTIVMEPTDKAGREIYPRISVQIPEGAKDGEFLCTATQCANSDEMPPLFTVFLGHLDGKTFIGIGLDHSDDRYDGNIICDTDGDVIEATIKHADGEFFTRSKFRKVHSSETLDGPSYDFPDHYAGRLIKAWGEKVGFSLKYKETFKKGIVLDIDPVETFKRTVLAWKDKREVSPPEIVYL